MSNMNKFGIQSPWVTYWNKVKALFELDDQVDVSDILPGAESGYEFTIMVLNNHEKWVALTQIMPAHMQFGNVTLKINISENMADNHYTVEAFKKAFEGNRRVRDIKEVVDMAGCAHNFVRFEPEVIQFYNDDLRDYNGNWTGLLQDIAREVFEDAAMDINFCTADLRENKAEE